MLIILILDLHSSESWSFITNDSVALENTRSVNVVDNARTAVLKVTSKVLRTLEHVNL